MFANICLLFSWLLNCLPFPIKYFYFKRRYYINLVMEISSDIPYTYNVFFNQKICIFYYNLSHNFKTISHSINKACAISTNISFPFEIAFEETILI